MKESQLIDGINLIYEIVSKSAARHSQFIIYGGSSLFLQQIIPATKVDDIDVLATSERAFKSFVSALKESAYKGNLSPIVTYEKFSWENNCKFILVEKGTKTKFDIHYADKDSVIKSRVHPRAKIFVSNGVSAFIRPARLTMQDYIEMLDECLSDDLGLPAKYEKRIDLISKKLSS